MLPWSATTCGIMLSRFSTDMGAVNLMSAAVTVVIGLVLSRLAEGMRVPVTVSFSTYPGVPGAAVCPCAPGVAKLTKMPALTTCATASDSFFLCILFIVNPHGVEYQAVAIRTMQCLKSFRRQ